MRDSAILSVRLLLSPEGRYARPLLDSLSKSKGSVVSSSVVVFKSVRPNLRASTSFKRGTGAGAGAWAADTNTGFSGDILLLLGGLILRLEGVVLKNTLNGAGWMSGAWLYLSTKVLWSCISAAVIGTFLNLIETESSAPGFNIEVKGFALAVLPPRSGDLDGNTGEVVEEFQRSMLGWEGEGDPVFGDREGEPLDGDPRSWSWSWLR